MTHKAPAEGTANTRQHYKDPDGRETVVHYPDLSAKHADEALGSLLQSRRTDIDSRERELHVQSAQVLATLALRDKVDELTAVLRQVVGESVEANSELSDTVKKATQHVVVELRKATVKAA